MHPLLHKDLATRFEEAAEVDKAFRVELQKRALKAQGHILDALGSEKRGYVVVLMVLSNNHMEMLAHNIFAGLLERSRRRIDKDAPAKFDECLDFSIGIKPIAATQPRDARPIQIGAELVKTSFYYPTSNSQLFL